MNDAIKKIIGLILMMISVFPLMLAITLGRQAGQVQFPILVISGIVLLVVGFIMYRLLKDSDE